MKKLFLEIGQYLIRVIKWLVFGNVAIYVATRIINFIEDPYMEDIVSSGYYRDELLTMFIQSILFLIAFSLVVSLFKILFKKDFKWQTLFTFSFTLVIVLFGIFY